VKEYVDDVFDYEPNWPADINPPLIRSRTVELAIPEQTSLKQWRQLLRAVIYCKDNNVKVVIRLVRG
jgi:CDI toxin restriction endonuclease-like domain